MSRRLLIATRNKGKVTELREMLTDLAPKVVGLDLFDVDDVEETGKSFEENAAIKASEYAIRTRMASIADDSGLQVDALGGRPGIFSARYGGDDLTFPGKMDLILEEMSRSGDERRSARFVSAIAVADESGGIVRVATGICEGNIADAPRGQGGFGYDPIFIPDGYDLTFGELPDDVKGKISHRARAFREIIPFLRHFIVEST